jgi:hypothetical protein
VGLLKGVMRELAGDGGWRTHNQCPFFLPQMTTTKKEEEERRGESYVWHYIQEAFLAYNQ